MIHDDASDGDSTSAAGPVDEACLRDLAQDLGGDLEELHALVTIYLDQSATRVKSARSAWAGGDAKGLQYVLHDLKSSSAMFGVFHVSRLAAGLENAIRHGDVLEKDIRALETAFSEAAVALPAACARLSPA
ncbi:MAG: Hpt domain-containing protein [Myxococcales bacterium]|nr:Hpt domain-containing protein [Myxococcales bacterium]